MTEISTSPSEEEQEQKISTKAVSGEYAAHFSETCYFQKHAFRNKQQRQGHSPVGLIGHGLMIKTLMMRHSRGVVTEMSSKKTSVASRKRKRVHQDD